ncbi:MAG: NAD(P)-dependent oxidoreductase [Magnetococcales bacterium]|nr:NAD(P)-dependent oxidoreductase [Magnetococcales bacterium]
MRIFLTGSTGFVGSWLLARLLESGHEVAIPLRSASDPWRIRALLEHPRLRVIPGGWNDAEPLRPLLATFRPEALAHLAWGGVMNTARNDPSQADNVGLTLRLIQLAAESGATRFLGVGSQAEYGPHNAPQDESTPTRPTTLYGAAKLSTRLMSEIICRERRMGFVWVRIFSTFGPLDHPGWMIPTLIRELLAGKRPALTPGEQLWDFLYVEDAADALARLLETPTAEGVFNLGSGSAPPLRQTIEALRDAIDPALPLGFGDIPYRPDQVMLLQAVTTRLQQATGWQPRIPLEEGLARTVAWFSAPP